MRSVVLPIDVNGLSFSELKNTFLPRKRSSFTCTLLFLLIFCGGTVRTVYAADLSPSLRSKVERIANNIATTQQQLNADGVSILANEMRARQLADRIKSYGASLAKMPSDDDAVLLQAIQAHERLVESYNLLSKRGAGASSAVGASAPPESAASDATSASETASSASNPAGKQLVSGQRVRVNKLTRDLNALVADLNVEGPSSLQDARIVERYRIALEKYAEQLRRYTEYRDDPDVRLSVQAYQQTQDKLNGEFQRAQAQLAELGDVQAILTALRTSLRQSIVPSVLYSPVTAKEASQWVAARLDTKRRAHAVLKEIERITPLAYLEINNPGTLEQGSPFDQGDVRTLSLVARENIAKADNAYRTTIDQLRFLMKDQQAGRIGYYERILQNVEENRSAFLAEGAEQEIYTDLDKMRQVPESLAAIQAASGESVSLEARARLEKLESFRAIYAESRQQLLGEYKLPAAASGDGKRIVIAREILANPGYGFGSHGPIVLTTERIETRSKEVSRDTIKDVDVNLSGDITWSGTRETWRYEWDEFKFATPLQSASGDWYVWWITAKYFHSGASTTPLNRWVSGAATQGDLILEKNFR